MGQNILIQWIYSKKNDDFHSKIPERAPIDDDTTEQLISTKKNIYNLKNDRLKACVGFEYIKQNQEYIRLQFLGKSFTRGYNMQWKFDAFQWKFSGSTFKKLNFQMLPKIISNKHNFIHQKLNASHVSIYNRKWYKSCDVVNSWCDNLISNPLSPLCYFHCFKSRWITLHRVNTAAKCVRWCYLGRRKVRSKVHYK